MNLEYSPEQDILRDSVERFVRSEWGFDQRRKILASGESYSAHHWAKYAELGWLALPFSEAEGGIGGGPVDVGIIMEGVGRALVLDPYLPTIVAGRIIASLGTPAQKERHLAALMDGSRRFALAFIEPQARYDVDLCSTTGRVDQQSGRIVVSGRKTAVFGGDAAETFVAMTRIQDEDTAEGALQLFTVNRDAAGLSVHSYRMNDGTGGADLTFAEVEIDHSDLLGTAGQARQALEQALDFWTACVASEAVGAMHAAWTDTVDYLKTRKQFGKPLIDNQVLQHRLVDMFIALEEARSSALLAALSAEGDDATTRRRSISLAKLEINRTSIKVGQEAVQLHGAMGMTEELPAGHYLKRLTAIAASFGDTSWHLQRICEISE